MYSRTVLFGEIETEQKNCSYVPEEKKRKKTLLSLSLSLASCIDNKNEEGENEKAFYNIFYLLSFILSPLLPYIY
jgi:hypothetical protein